MKLRLEQNVIVPLGTIKKFMVQCDEQDLSEDDPDNAELELEIQYPSLAYDGDFYWNEMSYHRLLDTSLTWNYNIYSDGDW